MGMAVSGEASVTETGAARYEIPIAIPPGTAGMAPSLTLAYDSQSGNGILGMGFQLEGLSAIERCAQTPAQDDVRGRIKFDGDDRFCLNGQRLIAISGTYGADGTEYRTEIESFAKVISYGAAGTGPAWFKVWTKAGQIIEFGDSTDTRILAEGKSEARLWAANKVSDRKGNFYTVTYVNDAATGEAYPSRIDYTGNDGAELSPYNSVRFVYETGRPDVMTAYLEGSVMTTSVRMTNIQTYAGDNLVSDYRLSYAQGAATNRSQLTQISLCDAADACLPATELTWQQGGDGTLSFAETVNPVSYYELSYGKLIPEDFNADGRTDFLIWHELNGTNHLFISTTPKTGSVSFTRYEEPIQKSKLKNILMGLGDFNSDGVVDVLTWGDNSNKQKLYVNDDSMNFVEAPIAAPPDEYPYSYPAGEAQLNVGDWNGDGLLDFVVWDSDIDADDTHRVKINYFAINQGNGNFTFDAPGVPSSDNSLLYFGDWNNDKLTDFLVFHLDDCSTDWYVNNEDLNFLTYTYSPSLASNCEDGQIHFAHLNNDKISDFGIKRSNLQPDWFANDGKFNFNRIFSGINVADGDFLQSSDWNLDNITDFVTYYYGNNNKFFTSVGLYNYGSEKNPTSASNYYLIKIGDWNGDGLSDPAFLISRNKIIEYPEYYSSKWYLNNITKPGLLLSISNGLGSGVVFTYKPMTDASIYTKDTGPEAATYPIIDLQQPSYLVSRLERSDGLGGLRMTDYHYAGAKADLLGRGFLGFREVSSTDLQSGIVQQSTYRQDYPFIGLIAQKMRTKDGITLSEQNNSYSATDLGGTHREVVLSQRLETGADLTGTALPTTTTTYQYDAFSNATEIAENTSDSYGKTTVHTYSNDTANWLIGQLLTANVTGTAPDLASQPPAADTTPDAFDFTDVTDAMPEQVYEDSAQLTGFNQPVTASVSAGSGEIRRNDTGSWGASFTVYPGDKLNLRMTASEMASTTVTVGGVSADWIVQSDGTPDAFDFTDVTGAATGTVYEDSAVVTGFSGTIQASVTSGPAELRANGTGSWGTSVTISSGDMLNIRMTSSASNETTVTAAVQVGASNADWNITTEAGCGGYLYEGYCWYLGTFSQSCDAVCSSHGGCDLVGTRDYVGSGGTLANCQSVASGLGVTGTTINGDTVDQGYGCNKLSSGYIALYSSPATTCEASSSFMKRICACGN